MGGGNREKKIFDGPSPGEKNFDGPSWGNFLATHSKEEKNFDMPLRGKKSFSIFPPPPRSL